MELKKTPGIYKEKDWEILQIKATVPEGHRESMMAAFGIDLDQEIKNVLEYELEMQLAKTMLKQLDSLSPTKRKLAISVAEEAPKGCSLIMNSMLACELQNTEDFEFVSLENSRPGTIELMGTYKGKNIYVFALLSWEENIIYQVDSDFVEYRVGKSDSSVHQILYYKIHSISPECKRYEIEETLHV